MLLTSQFGVFLKAGCVSATLKGACNGGMDSLEVHQMVARHAQKFCPCKQQLATALVSSNNVNADMMRYHQQNRS